MEVKIEFPFYGWTKKDLIEFCYGKNADVDPAIPMDLYHRIKEFTGEPNAPRMYVMDYTENKIGGKLVNLKEKFFDRVADISLKKENSMWAPAMIRNH